ncbi:MAG TPA: hypothetical protein VNK89_02035 [Thermoflexus sp.]|nr:hypothetical protein [Thermoflexus sp.]
MKKILRGMMWGLLLVGGGALALYFVAGEGNAGLLVGGILLLSLALNFWLLPAAFRGWLYGWIPGFQRVSPLLALPVPPSPLESGRKSKRQLRGSRGLWKGPHR